MRSHLGWFGQPTAGSREMSEQIRKRRVATGIGGHSKSLDAHNWESHNPRHLQLICKSPFSPGQGSDKKIFPRAG